MTDKAYKELSKHLDELYDNNGLEEKNREKWIKFVCDELKEISEKIDKLSEDDAAISNDLNQKNLETLGKIENIQSETRLCISELSNQLSDNLNKMYTKLIETTNKIDLKVTNVGAKYGAVSAVILNVGMWIIIYILKDHIFK